jgi:ABC-type sugar transport system ATPase subunit
VAPFRVDLVDVHKAYSGVEVIKGVSLTLCGGEVHALVGENGAGKSTLAAFLAGATRLDRGELLVDGDGVAFGSPNAARRSGIALVSQELSLVPKRSVVENVLAGQLPTWGPGLVSGARARRRLEDLVRLSELEVPAGALVEDLSQAHQGYVEILRALAARVRLLVLDEPTTAMTGDQAAKVMALTRTLADQGVAVVLITHTLEDVLRSTDVVTVLRDGRLVSSRPTAETTRDQLIHDMIGRSLDEQFPEKVAVVPNAPVVVRATGVSRGRAVRGVSFEVRAGEVLGIAGLVGSGRTELVRCVVGADRPDAGVIEVDDAVATPTDVRHAQRVGIVMIPENRKEQGLHLDHSIERNITLPHLRGITKAGIVLRRRSRDKAGAGLADVSVKAPMDMPVRSLSGGNQQRVLFAKWLVERPRVLIGDEPTRGVDVAGKRAIYELITSLCRQGVAVIVVSSELPEIIGLSHRVLVMSKGAVVAELIGDEITEAKIARAAFGETQSEREAS